MKLRMLVLAAMLGFAAVTAGVSSAHAYEEDNWCGTRYPGWWWHVHGPHSLVDNLKVVSVSFGTPVQIPAVQMTAYPFKIVLHNYGRTTTPSNTPFLLSHNMAGSAGYWSPDQPFNPNNPINPYASLRFETTGRGSLPALKPGQSITLSGRAEIPFSLAQIPQANILQLAVGYDGDEGICPPWPWPFPFPWPWPWPWWICVDGPIALLPAVQTQIVGLSGPSQAPWKGYAGYDVVFQITNAGKTPLTGGLIGLLHTVNMNNGNPNPDDPFEPRGPGAPYAEIFREQIVPAGLAMPTLQPGQSFKFKVHLNAPTMPGYGSNLILQLGK